MGIDVTTIRAGLPIRNGAVSVLSTRGTTQSLNSSLANTPTGNLNNRWAGRYEERIPLPWTIDYDKPIGWLNCDNDRSCSIDGLIEFDPADDTILRRDAGIIGNLNPHDNSFSVGGWIKTIDVSQNREICNVYNPSTNNKAWKFIYANGAIDGLAFMMSNDGTTDTELSGIGQQNYNGLVTQTWYFVVATYNSNTDIMSIYELRESGTTTVSGRFQTTHVGGCFPTTTVPFTFGAMGHVNSGVGDLDSFLDNWAFWYQKTLTDDEILTLYNNGNGLARLDWPESITTGLYSYWSFDQRNDHTFIDSVGSGDLTDISSIENEIQQGIIYDIVGSGDTTKNWIGGGLTNWQDSFVQPAVALRPQYLSNANDSYGVLVFDSGIGTHMIGESNFFNGKAGSVFCLAKFDNSNPGTEQTIVSNISGDKVGYIMSIDSNGDFKVGYQGLYGLHYKVYDIALDNTKFHIFGMTVDDKGNVDGYYDSANVLVPITTVGEGSGLWYTMVGAYVGAAEMGTTNFFDGQISELIIDNRKYQPYFIRRVVDYFKRKYPSITVN